jgi:signal-transduction protein with cAMP-binding, CBS, and nucleotidyltransferase domain
MSTIKLRDIVNANTKKLISVLPESSLQDAAREISAHRVGILMVVDQQGDVIGILSERDVTRAFADQGAKAIDATVADYMTTDVVMCDESEAPYTAIWLMHEHGIRHLPIAAGGRPKAIISSRDVLKYLSDHGSPEEQASLWEKTPPVFGY